MHCTSDRLSELKTVGDTRLYFNSNSNWTFIALDLPYSKGTLWCHKTKTVNQFQYPGTEKRPSTR